MSIKTLSDYLKRMGVSVKFYKFEKPTVTVDDAVKRLGISREKIVKSILFIDDVGSPILAIVSGDRRVSEKKLAAACGVRKVRKANSVEVKEFTGYDVGGVPPVGHKKPIRTLIDEKVMGFDMVVGGGGEINTLMEISPAEIKRLTNGEVKDISE